MKSPIAFAVAIVFMNGVSQMAALASTPHACSLVSFADAGRALDATVGSVTTRSTGDEITCSYRATAGFTRLEFTTLPFKSAAEAKSEFHAMISDPRTYVAPSAALPSIGDEAHRLGPSIYVRKNATIYVFNQLAKDTNGAGALRTIVLAKTTISHIP
jgi:hypothetical protein